MPQAPLLSVASPVPVLLSQLACRTLWATEFAALLWGMKCHPASHFPPCPSGNPSRYTDTNRRHPGWGTASFFCCIPTPSQAPDTKYQSKPLLQMLPTFFSHSLFARSNNSINFMEAIFLFPSSPPLPHITKPGNSMLYRGKK